MLEAAERSAEKKRFAYAVFIPGFIVILMILSFLLETGMGWDFHSAGVYPRDVKHIWSIFSIIFVHGSWSHLANNVISFFILGSFLYYFYAPIASRILILSTIVSGLILWVIGRESWHIGASGLIYALAFFLFFSGIIRKYVPLIAISFIVALLYGNMVWHIFPWEVDDAISWEGHLAGGIIGLVLALYYRNEGPQKPIKIWEEEDDSIEYISEEDETCETGENQKITDTIEIK
jgi:membrane associated rhomboid family serine protease